MTQEEIVVRLAAKIIEQLDADWVSDELDMLIPDNSSADGFEVLTQYDSTLNQLHRDTALMALSTVLAQLAGQNGVPAP